MLKVRDVRMSAESGWSNQGTCLSMGTGSALTFDEISQTNGGGLAVASRWPGGGHLVNQTHTGISHGLGKLDATG